MLSVLRLTVWTCAAFAVGVALCPALAEAQPSDPFFPPDGPYVGSSAARLLVVPKEAAVYVDGNFAGKVEEFDGFMERLDLPTGGHELTFYLEGYRTVREKLHFEPGATYKIKVRMEKLAAGESSGPRPEPLVPPRDVARTKARSGTPLPAAPPDRPESGFGTLSIRIQPPDTRVLIDDQPWEAPEPNQRLSVQVAAGIHRVEVRKDGWRTFSTSIRVWEGDVTTLNISLPALEPR